MIPPVQFDLVPKDPCIPSPCGAYSECRNIGSIPSCSCLATYIGNPPNCRPECTINSDCPPSQACMQQKCRDPCPGSCTPLAQCSVVNHIPICSCLSGYTGDPFTNCFVQPSKELDENFKSFEVSVRSFISITILNYCSTTYWNWSMCIFTLWIKCALW